MSYNRRNTTAPKEAQVIKKTKKVVEETPEEDFDEELNTDSFDQTLIGELKSNKPSDIESIIATAHKISKNQLTKTAPYQPKTMKRSGGGPKKVLDSTTIPKESKERLASIKEEVKLPISEIDEIAAYIKINGINNIKQANLKIFFLKLYNYEAAGITNTKIKNMIIERLDTLKHIYTKEIKS